MTEFLCTGAVTLVDYLKHFNLAECGFWGVARDSEQGNHCKTIWSLAERKLLAYYLCEAQDELEDVLGYPLQPKWFVDEQHPIGCIGKVVADHGYVNYPGVVQWTDIAIGTATNLASDPATITVATALTSTTDGIHVYYPGEDQEIIPDKLEITGGNLVITLPKCRLVALAYVDNPSDGNLYAGSIYLATVDVKLETVDQSTEAELIRFHQCSWSCSNSGCAEWRLSGCIRVAQRRTGILSISRADYIGGTWVGKTDCCGAEKVGLNYNAGLTELPRQFTEMIIRLAHAKMPSEPCGCDPVRNYWTRDRTVPDVLTAERLNCPFGSSDGAWWVWRNALNLALKRGHLTVAPRQ